MPSMMVATLGIALPEIRGTFSLSEVAGGSLFSAMMLVAAATSGIAGRLADRIGRKTTLITGLSLLAAGFILAAISQYTLWFFCCLGVTGIGYGFTAPSLYAIMADLLPHRRGLGTSLISVTYGIGGAVGALLVSRLVGISGWRSSFLTVGLIAASVMLLQLYWIRGQHGTRLVGSPGSIKSALSASTAILAAAEFIGGSVFWSSAAWTPTALRTAKALSLQETGWIMGLLSLANVLGSFTLGSLSDKFGRKLIIVFSALPAAAAAFIVFFWLESAIGLSTGLFIFGLLKASVPALVVALAQETAPPGSSGTAAGIIMSLHYTSGAVAPLIAAHLTTETGDIIFAMILVSSVQLPLSTALIGPRLR